MLFMSVCIWPAAWMVAAASVAEFTPALEYP